MIIKVYRRSDDWIATYDGDLRRWEAGGTPEEAIRRIERSFPELIGCDVLAAGRL